MPLGQSNAGSFMTAVGRSAILSRPRGKGRDRSLPSCLPRRQRPLPKLRRFHRPVQVAALVQTLSDRSRLRKTAVRDIGRSPQSSEVGNWFVSSIYGPWPRALPGARETTTSSSTMTTCVLVATVCRWQDRRTCPGLRGRPTRRDSPCEPDLVHLWYTCWPRQPNAGKMSLCDVDGRNRPYFSTRNAISTSPKHHARVAELADALDLGTNAAFARSFCPPDVCCLEYPAMVTFW
jgi:hypothetical protein